MILKSIEEIEKIRESALVVSQTLGMLASEIKPGITSLFLDNLAETFILDNLCKPGFKGYNGFPNTLCISINEQVVHGIPNNNPLKDGDMARRCPDNTKMRELLGRDLITIDEGIKKLLASPQFKINK